MRFVAPPREAVAASTFDHPAFARLRAHRDLLAAPDWPSIAALNERLRAPLRFVAQAETLDDGMHYEERIARLGAIATRERNWHDLLNALAWIEDGPLKSALNARQAADVAAVGPRTRTRGQCALTHFDEAGAIVVLRDASALVAWDAHDWPTFFARPALDVLVFGHALLEHALWGDAWLVAKCLVVVDSGNRDLHEIASLVAARIAAGALLADPQELRPLPLCGLPGWHSRSGEPDFIATAPCFQAVRPGRRYPAPYSIASTT